MPDPGASLSAFDIEYTINGRDFVLPAKNAITWLQIFTGDDIRLDKVIPGWSDPEARRHLYRSVLGGQFSRDEWEEMVLEVIGVAAGRKWWVAMNLINGMKEPANWSLIFGHLVLRGVDPGEVPLAAWLDATFALCTEHMEPQERMKFGFQLDTPPPSVKPSDAIDPKEQERAFLALMSKMGVSG